MHCVQPRFSGGSQSPRHPSSEQKGKTARTSADTLVATAAQTATDSEAATEAPQLSALHPDIFEKIVNKILPNHSYERFEALHALRGTNKTLLAQSQELQEEYKYARLFVNHAYQIWKNNPQPEHNVSLLKLAWMPPKARKALIDKVLSLADGNAKGSAIGQLACQLEHFNPEQRQIILDGFLNLPDEETKGLAIDGLAYGLPHCSPEQRQAIVDDIVNLEDNMRRGRAIQEFAPGLPHLCRNKHKPSLMRP